MTVLAGPRQKFSYMTFEIVPVSDWILFTEFPLHSSSTEIMYDLSNKK